jgi:hypothetical protein
MASLKSNAGFALESKVEINSQIKLYMEACKHCKALVTMLGMKKKNTLFLEKNIRAANEKLYFSKGFEIML